MSAAVSGFDVAIAIIIGVTCIVIALIIVLGFLLHSSNDYEEQRAFENLADAVERLRKRVDQWTDKTDEGADR